jgi:cytochrome c
MHRSVVAIALSLGSLLAATSANAADAKHGQQLFAVCQACHTVQKGGGNGIGPNLFGVAGRKAASIAGFSYSAALTNAKITWTNDKLNAWVTNPQKMVPGTRMTFAGFSDPAKAGDIVAYLDTLK